MIILCALVKHDFQNQSLRYSLSALIEFCTSSSRGLRLHLIINALVSRYTRWMTHSNVKMVYRNKRKLIAFIIFNVYLIHKTSFWAIYKAKISKNLNLNILKLLLNQKNTHLRHNCKNTVEKYPKMGTDWKNCIGIHKIEIF